MRSTFTFLMILLGCFLSTTSIHAQENDAVFLTEMTGILHSMKAYTLEVADRMPETQYNFRPVDSVMTFREQLSHICWILHFHTHFLLEEQPLTQESYQQQLRDYYARMEEYAKEELMDFTAQQFDVTIEAIDNLPAHRLNDSFTFFFLPEQPARTFRVICQTIRDHVTHHRAQMIVYLRLNGIEPPMYRLF